MISRSLFRVYVVALVVALLLPIALSTRCLAQDDDTLHIATARAALDNKDCQKAVSEVESVSEGARNTPKWLSVAGDAYTCVGDYGKAVECYEEYDHRLPGNAKILQAMGNANYLLQQQNAEDEKKKEEDLAEKKKQADKILSDLSGTWTDDIDRDYTIVRTANSNGLTGRRSDGWAQFQTDGCSVSDLRDKQIDVTLHEYYVSADDPGACAFHDIQTTARMQAASDGRSLTLTWTRQTDCHCGEQDCQARSSEETWTLLRKP